jgi:hypothetical protein
MQMDRAMPVPLLPVPDEIRLEDIEDAALALYERIAEADSRFAAMEKRLGTESAEQTRTLHRLVAILAAERFEFDRMMRRIGPELTRRNCTDLLQSIGLYARAWDLKLSRASLEVVDLAGYPLTDELAGEVEVESHLPDPSVSVTTVHETLVPLVVLGGKVIGPAKIVTSVPKAE